MGKRNCSRRLRADIWPVSWHSLRSFADKYPMEHQIAIFATSHTRRCFENWWFFDVDTWDQFERVPEEHTSSLLLELYFFYLQWWTYGQPCYRLTSVLTQIPCRLQAITCEPCFSLLYHSTFCKVLTFFSCLETNKTSDIANTTQHGWWRKSDNATEISSAWLYPTITNDTREDQAHGKLISHVTSRHDLTTIM